MGTLLKVLVHGATGKMGTEVLSAVTKQADMTIVAAVSSTNAPTHIEIQGIDPIPLSNNLEKMIKDHKPDVIVDFTNSEASMNAYVLHRAGSGACNAEIVCVKHKVTHLPRQPHIMI